MKTIYIFSVLTLICLTSCGQSSTDDMRQTQKVTGAATTHPSSSTLYAIPNPEQENANTHVEVSATPQVAHPTLGDIHETQHLQTGFPR